MSPARPRSSISAARTWSSTIRGSNKGRRGSVIGYYLCLGSANDLGGDAVGILERHEAAVAEGLHSVREIGTVVPPTALLALKRRGGDELGGGRHIGEAD